MVSSKRCGWASAGTCAFAVAVAVCVLASMGMPSPPAVAQRLVRALAPTLPRTIPSAPSNPLPPWGPRPEGEGRLRAPSAGVARPRAAAGPWGSAARPDPGHAPPELAPPAGAAKAMWEFLVVGGLAFCFGRWGLPRRPGGRAGPGPAQPAGAPQPPGATPGGTEGPMAMLSAAGEALDKGPGHPELAVEAGSKRKGRQKAGLALYLLGDAALWISAYLWFFKSISLIALLCVDYPWLKVCIWCCVRRVVVRCVRCAPEQCVLSCGRGKGLLVPDTHTHTRTSHPRVRQQHTGLAQWGLRAGKHGSTDQGCGMR